VKNVTATSYQPGTLSTGTTYYWKIVAKNSNGSTSSSIWSFTTTSATTSGVPATVSVNPSSGGGLYQAFSFVFSDSSGYQNLSGTHVLINSSYTRTNSCWIYFDNASKVIWLASNDISSWQSVALGSATTLQNNQCEINGGGASVTGSGNNLTLNVPIIFTTSFAGTKSVYMSATDKSGAGSGVAARGTWTVPATTTLGAVAVSPASGSGFSRTFSFVFSDPNGYQSLRGVHILVNASLTRTNACWLYYDAAAKLLWLASNDLSTWQSASPGSATTMQNSQCGINASGVSATGSGANLTLTVPIAFSSLFAGTRKIYMEATDKSGTASNYVPEGSWTVP
jgi:hypothetical protein